MKFKVIDNQVSMLSVFLVCRRKSGPKVLGVCITSGPVDFGLISDHLRFHKASEMFVFVSFLCFV